MDVGAILLGTEDRPRRAGTLAAVPVLKENDMQQTNTAGFDTGSTNNEGFFVLYIPATFENFDRLEAVKEETQRRWGCQLPVSRIAGKAEGDAWYAVCLDDMDCSLENVIWDIPGVVDFDPRDPGFEKYQAGIRNLAQARGF